MGIAFPHFNPGQGYVYADRLYNAYGLSVWDALRWLAHPARLWRRLSMPESLDYLKDLFAPVAFLPALAPLTLLIGAQLPLNLVSSWPYARQIQYHYSLLVLPFLFLALIRALERFRPRPYRLAVAAGALLVCLATAVAAKAPFWNIMELSARGRALERTEERDGVRALLAKITADASVSAHYRFLPALCLRRRIYHFPDLGPAGTWPDYVLLDLDRAVQNEPEQQSLSRILYEADYDRLGLVMGKTVLYARPGAAR